VQDPAGAVAPSMPISALKHVKVDYKVSLKEIGALLTRLTEDRPERKEEGMSQPLEIEVRIAKGENPLKAGVEQWGAVSTFACPECHGVLRERKEGTLARFLCHTGHAYSAGSLLDDFTERAEEAMWNAIRSLQERAMFLRQLAEDAAPSDRTNAEKLLQEAAESNRIAETLRAPSLLGALRRTTSVLAIGAEATGTGNGRAR
jgi:two-component system chemotaxis response regulator CheB